MTVLVALTYLWAVDPNEPGHYPSCPFRALTGLYCPGCGSLRALHALAHRQFADAVSRNALTMAAVPLLGWLWWRWARWRLGAAPPASMPAAAIWTLLGVALAFGVLRNVPVARWPLTGSAAGPAPVRAQR